MQLKNKICIATLAEVGNLYVPARSENQESQTLLLSLSRGKFLTFRGIMSVIAIPLIRIQ